MVTGEGIMSVGLATMGKFSPIGCGGGQIIERIVEVEVGGGGSYGLEKSKPQIIVRGVDEDDDDDFNIRIIKVKEWS